MTEKNSWDLEEEESTDHSETPAKKADTKIELFQQAHPGAHTKADLEAIGEKGDVDHHRAWLVLVDSDTQSWGIVEDTLGDINWTPGSGEIVGTWTRSALDKCIHVSLLTAINALEDRSIAIWSKYAEERKAQKATGKKSRSPRKPKDEKPVVEESVETMMAFNSLRAKLKRSKK